MKGRAGSCGTRVHLASASCSAKCSYLTRKLTRSASQKEYRRAVWVPVLRWAAILLGATSGTSSRCATLLSLDVAEGVFVRVWLASTSVLVAGGGGGSSRWALVLLFLLLVRRCHPPWAAGCSSAAGAPGGDYSVTGWPPAVAAAVASSQGCVKDVRGSSGSRRDACLCSWGTLARDGRRLPEGCGHRPAGRALHCTPCRTRCFSDIAAGSACRPGTGSSTQALG